MSDPTEPIWRGMIENAEPVADLAADRGQTWTTAQLQADFEVLSFVAPFMVVRRRKDGQLDSLEFTHEPASTSAGRRTADMPFQLSPDEVPGVAASAAVGKLTGDRLGDIRDALFLGLALGEMWWLSDLASDCAADGIYEMFLVSAPLNAPGGIGSPANAVAIK
jgi:hypothetical protein